MNSIRVFSLGLLVPLVLLSCPLGSAAQSPKTTWYRVPTIFAIAAIMEQRQCDLKIESVQIALSAEHRPARFVTVRNAGHKAITGFTLAWFTPGGGGEYREEGFESSPLGPGASYADSPGFSADSLPPLPDSLVAEFRRSESGPALMVFMIVHVTYEDGSNFDASDVYETLEDNFVGSRLR